MLNNRTLFPALFGASGGGGGGSGQTIQVTELPEAVLSEKDNIYQYIGSTTETLTNGYFYKCVEHTETEGGVITVTYGWENIPVMEVESGGGLVISETETRVGEYFGKPLYCKAYTLNRTEITNNLNTQLVSGVSGVSEIIDIYIKYKLNPAQGYGRRGIFRATQLFLQDSEIYYIGTANDDSIYNIVDCKLIMYYTKTTD